jgi:hypothetical protein
MISAVNSVNRDWQGEPLTELARGSAAKPFDYLVTTRAKFVTVDGNLDAA